MISVCPRGGSEGGIVGVSPRRRRKEGYVCISKERETGRAGAAHRGPREVGCDWPRRLSNCSTGTAWQLIWCIENLTTQPIAKQPQSHTCMPSFDAHPPRNPNISLRLNSTITWPPPELQYRECHTLNILGWSGNGIRPVAIGYKHIFQLMSRSKIAIKR